MRRRIIIAAIAFLLAPAALEAQTSDSDTAGWHAYRNSSGGYEFRYPDALKPSEPTGTGCTNGECKPREQVSLSGKTVTDGKITVRNVLFVIQRGINPQRLPIQQWYEALAHRPLNSSETVVTLGGKTAIHRGPFAQGATVNSVGGKTVSRSEGPVRDNTTFVPLNETDVLTIAIADGPPEWTELCHKVRSTLNFFK